MAADPRRILFLATAAVLLGVAAYLLVGHDGSPPPIPARVGRLASPGLGHAPPEPSPRRAVRRFLAAYLAYEVGDLHAAVVIRRSAAPRFAHEILKPHRRAARSRAAPVRIAGPHVARLPDRPDLVLITGTAERPSGPEPIAFLFALRAGRWLALAPAE